MDRLRRTIPGSVTSALTGLLMIGALAFGSTVIRPMTLNHEPEATTAQAEAQADDGTAAGHDSATEPDGDKPDGSGFVPAFEVSGAGGDASKDGASEEVPDPKSYEPPAAEPKEEPKPEPKPEPKDAPKAEPAPSDSLHLEAVFNADLGKIVVEWSAYAGDFEKYKLVRSTDAAATWPLGEGDELVDVVGPDGERRFVDANAPCNTELHYRAFAVRHGVEGYVVLAASNVDAAARECSEPAPPAEPKAMAFEVAQTPEGVQLSWEPCTSADFMVYKVVRSATNDGPMYPLNDGSELIGVIGNQGTTSFTDSSVEPGQTWHYRVLCMGQNADGWYVLGLTDAKSLTVE